MPKTQSLPKKLLQLRGSQLTGTCPLQSGARGRPRCYEDTQCLLMPGLWLLPPDLSRAPPGLPCSPRCPEPAQPHNFQPLPPDLHRSAYTHWGWTFSTVVSESCAQEHGGDGGGDGGLHPSSLPVLGCRTARITFQTPLAHSSLCCPVFHHPPQQNVYFPFKSSPRIIYFFIIVTVRAPVAMDTCPLLEQELSGCGKFCYFS